MFKSRFLNQMSLAGVFACGLLAPSILTARSAEPPLFPSNMVAAFKGQVVCEKLLGGWRGIPELAGRVVVGAGLGAPASGGSTSGDYWKVGVTIAPSNIPKISGTVENGGTVQAPQISVRHTDIAGGEHAFGNNSPTYKLLGYETNGNTNERFEIKVSGSSPSEVGNQNATSLMVAPPFVTLTYCVKN